MEKMAHIGERIEAPSLAEHGKELNSKLTEAQLIFADALTQKGPDRKFSSVLNEKTALITNLRKRFSDFQKIPFQSEEAEAYAKDAIARIDSLYEEGSPDRLEKISELLKAEEIKFPFPPNTDEKIGPFEYNFSNLEGLEKYGIDPEDLLFELHVDDLYKSGKEPSVSGLKEQLGKIAEFILKSHPATKAVIGTSWLMSRPLAKLLGFKITEKETPQNNMNVWRQFVDKEGQINQKRLEEAIKKGGAPYPSRLGYMTTEDFLRRYLPSGERGEIILKELRPEIKEKMRLLAAEKDSAAKNWDALIEKHASPEELLALFPVLTHDLEQYGLAEEWRSMVTEIVDKHYTKDKLAADEEMRNRLGRLEKAWQSHRRKFDDRRIFLD